MKSLNILVVAIATFTANLEAAPGRPTIPAQSILSINGKLEQVLSGKVGGAQVGKVLEVQRPDGLISKQIGQIENEELSLDMQVTDGMEVFDWINAVSGLKPETRNLSIANCDANFNITSLRDFSESIPTEFSISNFDATKREAGRVFLKVKPGQITDNPGNGKCTLPSRSKARWMSSNFKLEVDGLNLKNVKSIDNLKIQFKVESSTDVRFPRRNAVSKVYVSNFSITVAATDRKELEKWFNTFVVQGQNSDQDEKSASIVLLDSTLRNEIGRVRLFNVGIFKLSDNFEQGDNREFTFVTADLYAERIEFDIK